MKTVTITGFVYECDYGWGTEKEYAFYKTDDMSGKYTALIGPASFEYTIPDSFDPRATKVAALERDKQELKAKFAKEMMEIDERISKLLAITNEVMV